MQKQLLTVNLLTPLIKKLGLLEGNPSFYFIPLSNRIFTTCVY